MVYMCSFLNFQFLCILNTLDGLFIYLGIFINSSTSAMSFIPVIYHSQGLELEIDTYSGIVKEMGTVADQMIKSSHPESKLIKDRQQVIQWT